ncbi:16S rRNA (adenine(1518)-N(6)/adenine(1519)-N(6))-dimethyltransferaseRsmA [soil metagenome]
MPAHEGDTATGGGATLLCAQHVRALASRLDIRPTKAWGQNFVIDANTVRRIVRTAQIQPADHVLEVGPGLGSLTLGLLPVAASVTALEIDERLADALPATVTEHAPQHAERLRVLHTDALRMDSVVDPQPDILVANLPYNVAVPVVLHLLAHLPTLRRVLVMVQLEVAQRLAAAPGSKVYGVPSAKAAWYADVSLAGKVGRNVFWPAPNVDSGLVAIVCRDPPTTQVSREDVFAVVDAAFAKRRKTLRGALADWAGGPEAAEIALRQAGVDPTLRGERLDITDFARIAACRP